MRSDPGPEAVRLSDPMRDLLWRMAQHIYGWTYVQRYGGQPQVAEALERRSLAIIDRSRTYPTITLTDSGAEEVARR